MDSIGSTFLKYTRFENTRIEFSFLVENPHIGDYYNRSCFSQTNIPRLREGNSRSKKLSLIDRRIDVYGTFLFGHDKIRLYSYRQIYPRSISFRSHTSWYSVCQQRITDSPEIDFPNQHLVKLINPIDWSWLLKSRESRHCLSSFVSMLSYWNVFI